MPLHGSSRRDRWLLPYADFVTLLFAVFVLMYAMEKARSKQSAVPVPAQAGSARVTRTPGSANPARNPLLDDLRTNLGAESQEGFLTVVGGLSGESRSR
jgi:flagellar motor protein MotB